MPHGLGLNPGITGWKPSAVLQLSRTSLKIWQGVGCHLFLVCVSDLEQRFDLFQILPFLFDPWNTGHPRWRLSLLLCTRGRHLRASALTRLWYFQSTPCTMNVVRRSKWIKNDFFFLKVELYILMLTDTSPIWKDEVVDWIVVI